MHNKKGFTLVELLAVITVICIIALVSFPSLTKTIKNNQDDAYNLKVNDIILASKAYNGVNNNAALMIPISTLISNGYLTGKMIDPRDSSEMNGCVRVSATGDYTYFSESCNYCGKTAYCVTVTSFPELELGENGCKNLDENKNYTYMGGCYLKGAQTKNYLWYSGFLWRIMGINADKTIRLITEETVSSIPYNTSDNINFDGSHIDSWLNDYFYSRLRENNTIVNEDFCQGPADLNLSNDITDCTGGTIINRNIGLLSEDEISMAGISGSYLVNRQCYWIMSLYDSSNVIYADADAISGHIPSKAKGVRPIINVNSTISITSGDGTLENTWSSTSSPYILSENKTKDVNGSLVNNVTSGEYVSFAGKTYRVVNKETNGVKLMLDGYYQSTVGTSDTMIFGTNSTFSTTSGIGQTLNETILEWLIPSTDTTNRSKLVTNYTWYQNNFAYGDKYTVSLNETNPIRTISATVGLIRIGEMLASQSYTIKNNNMSSSSVHNSNTTEYLKYYYGDSVSYWALNSSSSSSSGNWIIHYSGNSADGYNYYSFAIRPVIVVNNSTQITSGNGTPSSPYQI